MVATLIRPDALTRAQSPGETARAREVAELEACWPELIAWLADGARPDDVSVLDVPRLAIERYVDLAA